MARFMLMRLTSQQEFAIWQPAWPTTDSKDISIKNEEEVGDARHWRCAPRQRIHTVDADDFSHFEVIN
jgi:hypothetical protein